MPQTTPPSWRVPPPAKMTPPYHIDKSPPSKHAIASRLKPPPFFVDGILVGLLYLILDHPTRTGGRTRYDNNLLVDCRYHIGFTFTFIDIVSVSLYVYRYIISISLYVCRYRIDCCVGGLSITYQFNFRSLSITIDNRYHRDYRRCVS